MVYAFVHVFADGYVCKCGKWSRAAVDMYRILQVPLDKYSDPFSFCTLHCVVDLG